MQKGLTQVASMFPTPRSCSGLRSSGANRTELYDGPCAKVRVRCTLVSASGRWQAENLCVNPQTECPRLPGEGYEKCHSVCQTLGHAEQRAAAAAGDLAAGGTAYVEGHDHACAECLEALAAVGVTNVVIGPPPAEDWPTPTSRDWRSGKASAKTLGRNARPLSEVAVQRESFPTPQASMVTGADMEQARYAGNDPRRPSYADAQAMFPTPQARDGDQRGPQSPEKRRAGGYSVGLDDHVGGSLNPEFVCWLMGWPRGWTDLAPLASAPYEDNPWAAGEWPGVPRIATGVPDRVARLRILGNGWVPQVVSKIVGFIRDAFPPLTDDLP